MSRKIKKFKSIKVSIICVRHISLDKKVDRLDVKVQVQVKGRKRVNLWENPGLLWEDKLFYSLNHWGHKDTKQQRSFPFSLNLWGHWPQQEGAWKCLSPKTQEVAEEDQWPSLSLWPWLKELITVREKSWPKNVNLWNKTAKVRTEHIDLCWGVWRWWSS